MCTSKNTTQTPARLPGMGIVGVAQQKRPQERFLAGLAEGSTVSLRLGCQNRDQTSQMSSVPIGEIGLADLEMKHVEQEISVI